MTRILVHSTPARGHLYPVVPIAEELRRRGHDVVVRTLSDEVDRVAALGFEAEALAPTVERIPIDDHHGRTPTARLRLSVEAFARRAPHDAEDLRDAIGRVRPEALLVDVNAWGGLAAAEASGLPWAAWCPYPLPIPSRDAPPFGPGLPPARGPLGRARDTALRPLVWGTLERLFLPRVNDVRAHVGLPPLPDLGSLYASPGVLLSMTAEPFEYPRSDWPANVRLVGPCAWEPPVDTPAWLDRVDRPVVLVTTSSEFQDDGRLVEVALEALAGDGVHVVATVPAGGASWATPRPSDATVAPFVPHGAVLDRAACAVTHGGMGVTQKALVRGVPVCAVPFGRDQLEVARRVVVAGAGTRLPAGRLTPARLRRAVHEAMDRRAGAEAVAEAFRAAGGPVAAADHLEAAFGASVSRRPRPARPPRPRVPRGSRTRR